MFSNETQKRYTAPPMKTAAMAAPVALGKRPGQQSGLLFAKCNARCQPYAGIRSRRLHDALVYRERPHIE